MSKRKDPQVEAKKVVRCPVYTRKSTEEGLEQAFNSLDAQRESGEAYVAAQRHEGWVCLPDRYDDGGYTGGNLDRPAMRRLLGDIEAGRVVMQVFDRRGVTFVSVTQSFRTSDSMGRLTLNILLSFAQFEREIISERTRDKIAAARRKGKFAGGQPLLGYDILSSPAGAKLGVNETEAEQVRSIFNLYVEHQALIPVVQELAERGWANKRWITRDGRERGGRAFDKTGLYKLLTNRTYLGLVTHHDEVHQGEHAAIVEKAVWERVRTILGRNGNTAGAAARNKHGALLKGILHCSCCNCSMTHTYSAKGGSNGRRYTYYVCLGAQKKGWDTCPSRSVPAGEIEKFVVEQIKKVGQEPAVLEGTLRRMRQEHDKTLADLRTEQKVAERELARHHAALKKLAAAPDADRLAAVHDQIRDAEDGLAGVRQRLRDHERQRGGAGQVRAALSAFGPGWERLAPTEQARVIRLLVERVEYDGAGGKVSVTFRPGGISALAGEQGHEVAA